MIEKFTTYWNNYFSSNFGEEVIRPVKSSCKFFETSTCYPANYIFMNIDMIDLDILTEYNTDSDSNQNGWQFWLHLRQLLLSQPDVLRELETGVIIYSNQPSYKNINHFCFKYKINSKNNKQYLMVCENKKFK